MATKVSRRIKIKARIRSRIFGTAENPRLSVYRSNKQIYAQLVDDLKGHTIISASSRSLDVKMKSVEIASIVGKNLAEKAIAAGITKCVFDRNGYLYHGRVKSLADGAREGGLNF